MEESQFNQTLSPTTNKPYSFKYAYDDVKRLTSADHWWYTTAWTNVANYDESGLTYDKNGNIKTLQRYRDAASLIDNLTYTYTAGTNRLASISDAVATAPEAWDAESGSFTYDAGGNVKTTLFTAAGAVTHWNLIAAGRVIGRYEGSFPIQEIHCQLTSGPLTTPTAHSNTQKGMPETPFYVDHPLTSVSKRKKPSPYRP